MLQTKIYFENTTEFNPLKTNQNFNTWLSIWDESLHWGLGDGSGGQVLALF